MQAYAQVPTVGPYANKLTDIEPIFARILNIATGTAGLVIFIMLIVGAFEYLTAGSNQDQIKKAGGTITAAIFGGALLIGVWLIIKFIGEFTGVNVTVFDICLNGRLPSGLCK